MLVRIDLCYSLKNTTCLHHGNVCLDFVVVESIYFIAFVGQKFRSTSSCPFLQDHAKSTRICLRQLRTSSTTANNGHIPVGMNDP